MKLNRVLITALVLCKVLIGAVWSEPEKVMSGGYPELAVDKQGWVWCVNYPGGVYIYPNEATGWVLETEAPLAGRLCFDRGDTLWLIDESVDYMELVYTRYFNGKWTDVDTVPTNIYWCEGVYITADSSGRVWVGWSTEWGYYYWDVGYNRYKDGTWDEPKPLNDTLSVIENELWSMTTDAEGRVWFVWKHINDPELPEECTPFKAIYCDGDAWSDEYTIYSQEEVAAYFLGLTPDHEGGMWAFWEFKPGPTIYRDSSFVLAGYWDGEAWSEPDTVANCGNLWDAQYPGGRIAVDGNGNAWAVWRQAEEHKDKYGDIYYSVNSGSGWSEPEPVDDDPGADGSPDIAVDGEGRIWCVWGSTRDDSAGVWASYTTSAGVEEPVIPPVTPSLIIDKSVGGAFTFRVSSPDIRGELLIYDAGGRVVRRLTIGSSQVIRWDGVDEEGCQLSSGVYFVRVESGTSAYTGKIVLVR
jgi:hypothetical protein